MIVDGNIRCESNSYFMENNRGIFINLGCSLGDKTPEIVISNTTFSYNMGKAIDISGVEEPFSITDCIFDSNNIGILFRQAYNSTVTRSISNCVFSDNLYGIFSFINSNLDINNCSFNYDNNGIVLFQSNNIDISSNDFNNHTGAGINSFDASFSAHDYNDFINCVYGISAKVSFESGLNETLEISDGNYFEECETAIDMNGYENPTSAKVFDNSFTGNEFCIYAVGYNHFEIKGNGLNSGDYNIIVNSSSNDHINKVRCNDLWFPQSGMQFHYQNGMTSFTSNHFNYTSWSDVIYRQGDLDDNIGNYETPALNYFSDNGGDISIYGNCDKFTYWLPSIPIPHTDPVHIPADWKNHSTNNFSDICNSNTVIDPVAEDTLTTSIQKYCILLSQYDNNPSYVNKKKLMAEKRKMVAYLYYFYSIAGVSIQWIDIESILKNACDRWFFQKKLYGVYMTTKQYAKADSMLDVIELTLSNPVKNNELDSLERVSKQSFVNIQRIGLRYYSDTTGNILDGSFAFTDAEMNTLLEEAKKHTPESANARALYYLATGEILPHYWYIPYEVKPEISKVESVENDFETYSVFPNPATDNFRLQYKGKGKSVSHLLLFDLYGKKLYENTAVLSKGQSEMIDVSAYPDGVYMLILKDDLGEVKYRDRLVINHTGK